MKREQFEMIARLEKLGFNWEQANQLRRISMTLNRWFCLECGDSDNYKSWAIERDSETDKPFMVVHPHDDRKSYRHPVADRENGARKRLDKIMAAFPDLVPYVQTDPRGASLHILRKADLNGCKIDSVYTRGVAVY